MPRLILNHNDRFYFGTARSIAKRLLPDDAHPALVDDSVREVEYHAEEEPFTGNVPAIVVYDPDGENAELPLDHPAVDVDTLQARRDDVRDVFLPDALDQQERRAYADELQALRRELKRRAEQRVQSR